MATDKIDQTLNNIIAATRAKLNQGGDGWKGHCPAHKDKSPSFSIDRGHNGGIVLNCHRGCDKDSICSALNITQADLFPPKQKQTTQTQIKPAYSIDKVYDYKDESGTLLFQTVRKRLTDPKKWPDANRKDFKQRAPDGKGNWIWSLKNVRRVLYRLPELLAADPDATVWICEGEKDVDKLRSLGLIATCNPMGAGKWLDAYSDFLIGRDCVILPDNDPQATEPDGTLKFYSDGRPVFPGQDHAQEVAASVYSKAKPVRVLMLPNLPEKGDVGDWLDAGGDKDQLIQLANALPEWAPDASTSNTQSSQSRTRKQQPIQEICLADIQVTPVRWLWKRRIARGAITILEGMEGEGKSTVLCAIAAAVTCGKGLDDMIFDNGPENVLWMSAEDSPEQILKPRLLAANADPLRVFVVGEPFTFDDKGIDLVREMLERRRPALLVIDPIFAYVQGDPNKGADTRATTNKLKQLAEEFDCAIVLVRHIGKSKGFGDPRAAGLYSIEWRAAARSVLLCGSDPDSQQTKALTQSKNNLSPFAESIGFVIEEHPPGSEISRTMWTGISQLTAKRILASVSNEEETAERADAEEFLHQSLMSGDELANGVKAEARKAGISPATLNRARWKLGIVARKAQGQKHGPWYWGLPNGASQHDQNGHVDHVDLSEADTTIAGEKQVKVINDHVDSRESPYVNMIIDHLDLFSGDNPMSTEDLSQDDQHA